MEMKKNLFASFAVIFLILILIPGAVSSLASEQHREGEMKKFCNDKGACITLEWDGIGWTKPEYLKNTYWAPLLERYKKIGPNSLTTKELFYVANGHDYKYWDKATDSWIYVPENAFVQERIYKESIKRDPMRSIGYSSLRYLCDEYLHKFKPSCYDEVYNLCVERVKKYPFYIEAYIDLMDSAWFAVINAPFNETRCREAMHYVEIRINRTKNQINTCEYEELLDKRIYGWNALGNAQMKKQALRDHIEWLEKYYESACYHGQMDKAAFEKIKEWKIRGDKESLKWGGGGGITQTPRVLRPVTERVPPLVLVGGFIVGIFTLVVWRLRR